MADTTIPASRLLNMVSLVLAIGPGYQALAGDLVFEQISVRSPPAFFSPGVLCADNPTSVKRQWKLMFSRSTARA